MNWISEGGSTDDNLFLILILFCELLLNEFEWKNMGEFELNKLVIMSEKPVNSSMNQTATFKEGRSKAENLKK